MDTEKVLKEQKIVEQPIQVEKQEDTIGQDWVNVDTEWSTETQVRKVRVSEGVSVNSPEAQKAMKSLVLYEPIRLTKKDLSNATKEEIKQDKAVKKSDLQNYSFNQLTRWARLNAKVKGADSSFIKLVESLVNIQALFNDMRTGSSLEALNECQKRFESALTSLAPTVNSYYNSHKGFFVFSDKGKYRLELCRVLQERLNNGLLDELRKDADYSAQICRINILKDEGKKKRDDFIEKVQSREMAEHEYLFELRKDPEFSEFENSAVSDSAKKRKQLGALFKMKDVPGAEEWNEKALKAIKEYNKSKDLAALDEIIKDMMVEVSNIKLTPEMTNMNYALSHTDVFGQMKRLTRIYGDFGLNKDAFPVFSKGFERVAKNNPELNKKFELVGLCGTNLFFLFGSELGEFCDISMTNLLEGNGDQIIKPKVDLEDANDDILYLFEKAEEYRKQISDIETARYDEMIQTDMTSQKYYTEKYLEKFRAKDGVNSEDYNRVIGQSIFFVERDQNGNPIEEDKAHAEINEKYIDSLMTGDKMKCADACYDFIVYALKNESVLFDSGTDLEKFRENYKVYTSVQRQFLNFLSISFGAKKELLQFFKSKEAPEGVKNLHDTFDELNTLGIFQNAILRDRLISLGLSMEKGEKVEAVPFEKTSSGNGVIDEYNKLLAQYNKAHTGKENPPIISKEEFLKAFKQYLDKQDLGKSE